MAKTQRGNKKGKAKTSARAAAGRTPRSTARTTRPAPAERTKAPRSPEAPTRAPAVHAPRTAATESRGKYVYCIIRVDDPMKFGPIGIGAEPADVHTVNYKELAAVVSDTPIEVFDATRENVLAHERVNETVMRNHTVIPMSFGTVFKTRDDIVELLRAAYEAFNDVLNKMQDKLEFGLKVLWDRDVMIREIESEDDDVRRLKGEISSQKGSTYFARMQYGRLMDAALEARSERYVRDIFEQLRPVSVASRANKPIGDKMIMNAAFLVAREKESAFDAKVKQIGARHGSLTFKYTGPWPPYNFVNIRLKLERAREGE
ncbi:MAG TPA: GvpL/GvpF family gas vesicle protein [Vicinamibacteria bacterium]|nr:GvpL/GvpF family gas vesicle protein [Vicinamibacteria bacterium]